MTENEFTYWAFLSYSQQDNLAQRLGGSGADNVCWGDWLQAELKAFAIPPIFARQINAHGEIIPEQIDSVYSDHEEQPGNATLSETVRQALAQSRCLVVICSPRSAKSLRVDAAVRYFKQLGRSNRILPIVIAGEPNASDGLKPSVSIDDECFVPALRHPVKPDGTIDMTRRELSSIFADARQGDTKQEILIQDQQAGSIGLETAKIQLIAGLIGVGFNGLWNHELKRRFAGTKIPAPTERSQFAESPKPPPEIQNELLIAQSQARAAQQEIQELRNQVTATQEKVIAAQQQAREALDQVAAARQQAESVENQFLEAQRQARETQAQLEEARNQVRAAQDKFLEVQNLPQDVKSQIEQAQTQARDAQSQTEAARNQAQQAQSEADAARREAREVQSKFLEAQNQVSAAQLQVQEIEKQVQQTQSQLETMRAQAQAAESKVQEARQQAIEAQSQVEAARNQFREAQEQLKQIQNQTRDTRAEIQAAQQKTLAARRLTKVFAVLAVLAALAVSVTWWQRNTAAQPQSQSATADISAPSTNAVVWNRDQIQQALQKISGTATNQNQLVSLDELAAQIPTEEISETMNAAADILADPQRSRFQEQLLDRWINSNLPAAFDWSCQATNLDLRQQALGKIIPAMPADQLTNTLTRLNGLTPAPGDLIYTQLFQRWATNDLDAATTACEQLPAGPAKEKVWALVLSRRIVIAPESAAEVVENLPPGDFRQKAIVELCNHWVGATNAPAVLDWAQSLPFAAERIAVTNLVVANWSQKNPQGATEFAGQHPELSATVFGEMAVAWFQQDATAATNWVVNLPDVAKKDAALLALANDWSKADPRGMAVFALALTAGEVQTRYLTVASQRLAARDLSETVELLLPLADATLRQQLLESAVRSCDVTQLGQAAKYIATMPAGTDQKAAIKGLVATWSPAEPEATLNWLITLPETNAQPEEVASALQTWAQSEPTEVARWLASLPAKAASESMVSAFLAGAVVRYPEYAAQWTQSVTDESLRQKYQIQVAREWLKSDSSAAHKWIESLGWSDAIKQTLKAD